MQHDCNLAHAAHGLEVKTIYYKPYKVSIPCVLFPFTCRIWFWVKDPTSVSPGTTFSVARDNVYVAIVLLGIGGATVLVLSYTMISQLVGRYTVCYTAHYTCR